MNSILGKRLIIAIVSAVVVVLILWMRYEPAKSVASFDAESDADVLPAKQSSIEPAKPSSIESANLPPPQHRPVEVAEDGFVSSDACKECHLEQYASWHDSYHRQMTQLASQSSVIGDFEAGRVEAYGRDFVLSKRGDEYWVNMHYPDREVTADSERIDRRIVMTTGAHHMQMYWFETGKGRDLGQLPVAWLKDTAEWVPRDSLFISPPPQPLRPSGGRWNAICIKCHTTHGQPRIIDQPGDVSDTRVAEFGISCEACHGPGQSHVEMHRGQPTELTRTASQSENNVVHPAKLSKNLSASVCGQCHGIWIENQLTTHQQFLRSGRSFVAGEELSSHGHVFGTDQPESAYIEQFLKDEPYFMQDRFWSDGMPRVSGSEFTGMIRSACHQRGEMSCLTCHTLHHSDDGRSRSEWANDQLSVHAVEVEACLSCHENLRDAETLADHTHHQSGSTGSNCYNCHMPHTTYGLVKAIRSHEISSPDAADTVDHGRPNACNLCHLDKSLEWTAKTLSDWYEIAQPSGLSDDQRLIADSILSSLSGDAGQRALAAASMGWAPAQEVSGTDWMVPVLAQLMLDPYDAVRHVAHKSLRTLPRYRNVEFRYAASAAERTPVVAEVMRQWKVDAARRVAGPDPSVLLLENGEVDRAVYSRLFRSRDQRQVLLAE